MVIYSVGRKRGRPCQWSLQEHQLLASSQEQANEWGALVNECLQRSHNRLLPHVHTAQRLYPG